MAVPPLSVVFLGHNGGKRYTDNYAPLMHRKGLIEPSLTPTHWARKEGKKRERKNKRWGIERKGERVQMGSLARSTINNYDK